MQINEVLPSPNYPDAKHPLAGFYARSWDRVVDEFNLPNDHAKDIGHIGARLHDEKVSERIAELAREKGLTQGEIASKMGVSGDTVSRMFLEPSGASRENVTSLLDILGCTVEQLRGEDGPRPSEEISSMYDALSDTSRDMVSKLVQRLWGFEHLS